MAALSQLLALSYLLATALAASAVAGAPAETCSSGSCQYKGSVLLQSKRSRTTGISLSQDEEDQEDLPMPADVTISDEVVRKIQDDRLRTPPLLVDTSLEAQAWIDMKEFDSGASVSPRGKKKMYDGNPATHGGAIVFQLDMGQTYEFSKTRVDWRACQCEAKGSVMIAVSIDNKNWYTYVTPTLTAWGDHQERVFMHHNLRGRYVKVWVTELARTYYMEIWDFSIFGRKDPASHPNVYGWWRSYTAGEKGLSGTEMVHLYGYDGKLFGGTGYWMHSGDWRAAEVVRLDCPYCDWVVEATVYPYAGRTEILKAVEWTTDSTGNKLSTPVNKLISGFYVDFQGTGKCFAAVRDDATKKWPLELYWQNPFKKNHFSARALQLYQDTVTGVDILFFNSGMDGIIPGKWDPSRDTKVKFATSSEAGTKSECRPLALAVMNNKLFFSASSKIKMRINGPKPSWKQVWDHLDHDTAAGTVDEAVGGIRGITGIANPASPTGESLLFSWAPNGRSEACMVRLDGSGDTLTFKQEKCVKELAKEYLGKNNQALEAKVCYSLADYNFALELPGKDGPVHIIGYQILLFAYSAVDFPTDATQTRTAASGKPIGYYAGAGYLIRKGAGNYEVREPGGPRYNPAAIFPKFVAVRSLAASPWPGDRSVYMGGYDCNFFPAINTAWVMSANFDSVFEEPQPCQLEEGCGHVPGTPFKRLGCDWCGFREFAGSKHVSFNGPRGSAITCQSNMDLLNSEAGASKCAEARYWPSEPICCLGERCDFCLDSPGTTLKLTNVAGKNSLGESYDCKSALDYTDSGATTCSQGRKWWGKACCS